MGLKKYGIQTNYKPGSGDKALDAAIEAIKKDPEMKHMWGFGDRFKVKNMTTPQKKAFIAKARKAKLQIKKKGNGLKIKDSKPA